MVEESFTDQERQLLILLATKSLVEIDSTDLYLQSAIQELNSIIKKLTGTDTVIVARRAYTSSPDRGMNDDQAMGRARSLYRDPRSPPRVCDNPSCRRQYTGASVYCSLECAIGDA